MRMARPTIKLPAHNSGGVINRKKISSRDGCATAGIVVVDSGATCSLLIEPGIVPHHRLKACVLNNKINNGKD